MINSDLKIPIECIEVKQIKSFLSQKYDLLESEFDAFYAYSDEVMSIADTLISKTFDTSMTLLENEIQDCLSLSHTIGQCVADINTYNTLYESTHYTPKQTKLSETDRTRYIDTKTIPQKNLLAKLKKLEDKLDKKITIGQSILKAETQRMMKEMSNDL